MIGTQLENAGWRQGSSVKASDANILLTDAQTDQLGGQVVLLLASQSCDIANNNVESDPFIELSIARRVDAPNGNLTYNKNPRVLHTSISIRTLDATVLEEEYLELRAHEKIAVPKEAFLELAPDSDRTLEDRQLQSYVAWLAARYSRPALPTTFNDRIMKADRKGKTKKQVKKGGDQLTGIYVEITPDAEVADHVNYHVNILGLLPAGFVGDRTGAESAVASLTATLVAAGMDVKPAVRTEDEVSIALMRRFKRFYYDDLSFRDDSPLPVEVENIL